MPLYEYLCKKCEHGFELLVQESTVPQCPQCKSKRLAKQHSVFSASVKGGESRAGAPPAPGGCGTCGDPRGPGACSFN